jgi:hypothetical protein
MGKYTDLVEATLNPGHKFEGLEVGDKLYITRKKKHATITKIGPLGLRVDFEDGSKGSVGVMADFEKIED